MGPQCHREIDSNVIIGCEWSEWTPWSRCTKTCGGGSEQRVREKLPGLGSCADGNSTDSRLCQVSQGGNSMGFCISNIWQIFPTVDYTI